MPLHLTRISPEAALPDPATLDEGYPILHGGALKVVNAAQDGFDTVAQFEQLAVLTAATLSVTTESIIAADPTAASQTITLPAAPDAGHRVTVKKADAGANTVTVETPGSETIDGAANLVLSAAWAKAVLVFDGTDWLTL